MILLCKEKYIYCGLTGQETGRFFIGTNARLPSHPPLIAEKLESGVQKITDPVC